MRKPQGTDSTIYFNLFQGIDRIQLKYTIAAVTVASASQQKLSMIMF